MSKKRDPIREGILPAKKFRAMNDKDNPTDKEIADALRGLDPEPNTLMRSFEVEFGRIRCITCDISFYVPKFWQEQRRKNHRSFYCPNGHGMEYGKSVSD